MALIDDLVSYWSLDETTGTRVDSHGSNDLTEVNGVTGTSGVATFNGSNDYLNIASNASLQMGNIDFTIVYFFRASSVSGARGHVAKTSAAGGTTWEYYCRTSGTTLEFNISDGTNNGTASTTIANTTWYFVTAIHDSVNNELRLYVDATLVSTVAWTTGGLVSTGAFALGARPATSYAHFFAGDMDEVGIWKRALTPAEITDLYNGGDGRNYAYIEATGESGAIEGTASVTLGALTSTATGALSIAGATSATLSSATLSSTGALSLTGSLSSTLGALTVTATGELIAEGSGSLAVTLGALTVTAAGQVAIVGVTGVTLGALTLSATGDLEAGPEGALSVTLGALTAVATGALSIAGVTGVTLGALTVTSSGAVALTGQAVINLGTLTLTGVGVAVLAVAIVGSVEGVGSTGAVVGVSAAGRVTGAQSTGVI